MVATTKHTRPTDAEVIERRIDLEMIQRPHLWPLRHWLPVTKGRLADPAHAPLDSFGYILARWPHYVILGLTGMRPIGALRYETAADIIADGWLVD